MTSKVAKVLETITMVPLTDIGQRAIDDLLQSMDKDSNVADIYIGIQKIMEAVREDLNLRFQTVSLQTNQLTP